MPYKTGKLKGQLTSAELRKLIKAHNKLYTIKVPAGATQPEIVKLINDGGYSVNHKKQSLFLQMKNLPRKISMNDVPKKVEPTALQKQKQEEAKELREKKKKKELREAKIGAVKKFQKANPPRSKPVPKSEPKPKQEPIVKKKPISDKPKPKRRQIGKTQKPSSTIIQKTLPEPPKKKPAQPIVKKPSPKKPKRKAKQLDIGTGNKGANDPKLFGVKPIAKKFPNNIQKVQDNPNLKDILYIEVSKETYPLKVSEYPEIRNIPFEDIWKNMVDKRSNIFYPFAGFKEVKDILYFSILNDNENICALPKEYHDKILQLGTITDRNKLKDKPKEWTSYRNPSMMLNRLRGVIATRFLSCASMNETLAIPISLSGGDDYESYHANMLIFNPFSWEVEHYEPHGEKYQGQWVGHNTKGKSKSKTDGYWVPDGINFKQAIENINKEIKRQFILNNSINTPMKRANVFSQQTSNSRAGKLKYLPPNEVCPSPALVGKLKSFQSEEGFSEPKLFEGVVITEPGGYCALWSMYFLDLRLKTMRKPVQDIYKLMATELDKEYKKSSQKYIELIRGVSKYGWEKMKILATPKYMKGYSQDDLINYFAGENDTGNNRKEVVSAVGKLISDLQGDIAYKYGQAKLKYNNKLKTRFAFVINPTTDSLSQNISSINVGKSGGAINMYKELDQNIFPQIIDDFDFRGQSGIVNELFKIKRKFIDWDNIPINKIPKKDRVYMYKVVSEYIAFRKKYKLNDAPLVENISDDQVLEYITKYLK